MTDPLDFRDLGPCTPGDAEWQRRLALFMADPSPMQWWWMVFTDESKPKGKRFLGLCIMPGANPVQAMQGAWALGCNPGGAVASYPLDVVPRSRYVGRLFVDPEAQRMSDDHTVWALPD